MYICIDYNRVLEGYCWQSEALWEAYTTYTGFATGPLGSTLSSLQVKPKQSAYKIAHIFAGEESYDVVSSETKKGV